MQKHMFLVAIFFIIVCGCTHKVETQNQVELAPIEIKPIHITLDINLKIQVDKELDNFFGDLDK